MVCAFASPAHAWHLFGQTGPQHGAEQAHAPSNDDHSDEHRQRRAERQQLRDDVRDHQRDGMAPTGNWEQDEHGRRMSPEERRQFRRDIDDAGRQIYGPKRGQDR